MKRSAFLGAFLLASWLLSPAQTTTPVVPSDAQHTQQAQPWESIPIPPLPEFHPAEPKRIELKNGMIIFLMEDHELPFVNGFINIKGGSRNVPADKLGLIGLYGEAWRTSGTATQSGDKLDDILAMKAASVETSGDIDSTQLSWSCLKQDEDLVFGIAVDLLEHPAFNEQKLKLAQQQAATAIVRRNDDAGAIAEREAAKLVYGAKNPYGRVPEIATVMSVSVADLKAWHDQTVVPNGMIVGVIGDFDSAVMERKLREAFDGLPRGTVIAAPVDQYPGPKPGVYLVDKKDVNQSDIWILGLGTERKNPDYFALSVMNEIFSGGFGSRLFQDVRTRRGLAYSVGGRYGASYDHPGMFDVVAGTKSVTTVETTQAMMDQIKALRTQPFTETELKRAKDQVLNSFIFNYDTKEKVLAERVKLEFYGYPADYLERYHDAVEKVTIADVTRVANKYIDPSKLAVLVVGNESEFGTPLSKLGPVQPIDITIPMPPGMQGAMGPGDNQ